ncbi:hypothetical protein ILT44_17795 [Microvirga sp. BT689]|uniref:lipopolysaccharide biosynthesis protein n=1 Tax=Microvirga arvi TaxID=2778731 RepID=UPI00194DBA29|nr:hypothetical protein [Microvirga arvi]MBM6582057.1 hypothetical protein [Microvirga arvi]
MTSAGIILLELALASWLAKEEHGTLLKGSLTQRITIAAAARIGVLLVGLCFQILLARMMLPEEYAKYAVALAGASLFCSVADLGVTRVISRFLPLIMLEGSRRTLREAIVRYVVFRFGGILTVTTGVGLLLWVSPFGWTLDRIYSDKLVFVWFILLFFQSDMQSIARSLMEDTSWAVFSLIEIFARAAVIAFLGKAGILDAEAVIETWALTSLSLIVGMATVFLLRRHHYELAKVVPSDGETNLGLLPSVQLSFALGTYLSSISYLATSPAAVRLASAPSLAPVPLAAVSFIQSLINSVHSALPVHLVGVPLEPALISKISKSGEISVAQDILGVLLKAETIIILFGMVISVPLAPMLLRLISREEFSSYGYIIPIILLQFLGKSCYRIMEIMAGITLRHRIFAATLPLGVACLTVVFMTTPKLGLFAVLFWPIVEVLIRIGLLRMSLGQHGSKRILDTARLGPLFAVAGGLIVLCEIADTGFDLGAIGRVLASIAAGTVYVLLLLILRPVRKDEYKFIVGAVPKLQGTALNILRRLVH